MTPDIKKKKKKVFLCKQNGRKSESMNYAYICTVYSCHQFRGLMILYYEFLEDIILTDFV